MRQPIESSNLVSIGHDGTALEVEFKGGHVYRYDDVSVEEFNSLLSAKSIGGHFHEHVRPKYAGKKQEQK